MLAKLPITRACALAAALLVLSHKQAYAEELAIEAERVTLAMILPVLTGSELGELELGPAPLPGESIVLHASDIKAKLKASGRDARGLAIPKSTRLVRHARSIEAKELDQLVTQALSPRVAPCVVEQLSALTPLTIASGEFELEADPLARKQSGRTSVALTLRQGERVQRMSLQAVLSCPAPVVTPGAQVRLTVVSGAVRVSAPGTATQAGRVGDEIRVTNQLTKKSLRARVIDAHSVEVIP
jgi:flagella basal body P-ring formation protein FlgA